MMHYKITTTKKVFITRDIKAILAVKEYGTKSDYGKKPPLPTFRDVRIIVNPQYVILMEQLEDDGKEYPSLDKPTVAK
jgi:hypothetical protein